MKYLRDRGEYENRYDRMVIERCREIEKDIPTQVTVRGREKKTTAEERFRGERIARDLYLYLRRVRFEERREACISEWMQADRQKDEFFEKTTLNIPQYCHQCNRVMELKDKTLMSGTGKKEKDRILFFYDCSRCKGRRAIYDNGEELEPIEYKCEKCFSAKVKTSLKSRKNGDTVFQELCMECHHIKKDIWKHRKEKPIDPNYEADRKRFRMPLSEAENLRLFIKNAEEIFARREKEKTLVQETKATAKNGFNPSSDLRWLGVIE